MDSLIRLATLQAEKVEIYRKYNHKFRLGAVLFKKKNVISVGRNHAQKTHPRSTAPYKTLHAEMDCILSVPKFLLEDASLLVVRIGMNGNLMLAKPCKNCHELIRSVGIRKLYWSTEESKIESMRVN